MLRLAKYIFKIPRRPSLLYRSPEQETAKTGMALLDQLPGILKEEWLSTSNSIEVVFDCPVSPEFNKLIEQRHPSWVSDFSNREVRSKVIALQIANLYSGVLVVPLATGTPLLVFKEFGKPLNVYYVNFRKGEGCEVSGGCSSHIIYWKSKVRAEWPKELIIEYGKDVVARLSGGAKYYPDKCIELPLSLFLKQSAVRLADKGLNSLIRKALREVAIYPEWRGKSKKVSDEKREFNREIVRIIKKMEKTGDLWISNQRLNMKGIQDSLPVEIVVSDKTVQRAVKVYLKRKELSM